jgi:cytochrome c oxidase cbb3-type subunit 1
MKYDDTAARWMIYPSILFMILGMFFGTFIAFNTFVFPDYFSGEYVHFGRVRPVHVMHVTLLWLLSVDIGLFYYFVPRLCGTPLWSPKLANYTTGLWWFSLILGTYSLPTGTNTGWEYAELPYFVSIFPIKALFTIAFLMAALNFYMTIARRKFEKMYVSLWYVMGTLFWTAFTWVVGAYIVNLVPGGISRVNVNFFYVHNLVGLIFTPMGLATAYYALPKLSGLPIYSHRLSMIGFWSIAFVYAWIGAHHIIHGPMSQWLQTTSIVFSLWLFIPVWTVVANIFATLSGHWDKYAESPPLRFLMMGNIFYLITCIQGPLMALRNINEITSKTDWVIGHSHISLYATFTFFAFAGIYQALPALTGKKLWSPKLASWHFTLNMFGSFPFIFALWLCGFLQGMQWAEWAHGSTYAEFHRRLAEFPFLQTLAEMRPWWILRGIGGLIILFANLLFVLNVFNTLLLPERKEEVARA